MEETKIGFFRRIKKAIFNFDEYSIFSREKVSKAFKYLFKIIAIMTILITITTTYKTFEIAKETIEVFKNEAPDFEIKGGILTIQNDEKFQYIDNDNYFGIIVDGTREQIEDVEYNEGIVFAKDRIYIKTNGRVQAAPYSNFINNDFSKKDIEGLLTRNNLIKVYLILGGMMLISNFIAYTIVLLINILVLSILGMLVNWLAKTNLRYGNVFIIATYAITLPAILLTAYTIITVVSDFTIKYFNLAYDIISYIYVVTAILMMKSDLIKNKQELFVEDKKKEKEKPVNVDVKKEKKKSKEKKEEKKDSKKEEKTPGEPEGSNA